MRLWAIGVIITLFVVLVSAGDSCKFYDVQKTLSEYCSDTIVSKQDQRMLGHGDILLPVFAYHYLPSLEATSNHQCVAMVIKDWILSNLEMIVEAGADNSFHFSLFNHDADHAEWKIELVKSGISGLPVYHVSSPSQAEEYFVKLYSYPQATDAFHADLFASYALDRIPTHKYFDSNSPSFIRKCLVNEEEIVYASLTKKITGRSIKSLIVELRNNPNNEDLQNKFEKTMFNTARAIGEFHFKTSEISGIRTAQLLLPSDEDVSKVLQGLMGTLLPEAIIKAIAAQLEELYEKAKESLSESKTPVPNIGCFAHFDLTSSNVFIDESSEKITLLDSPLMFRSFAFGPFGIKCETESFLANPLVSLVGNGHPALDYYFFSTYVGLEMQDLKQSFLKSLDSIVQDGYCTGWFSDDTTKLENCKSADHPWTVEVENFYLQYLVSVMSPDTIATAIKESVKERMEQE